MNVIAKQKMNNTKTIYIAKDFSKFPIGKYTSDGPHSAERFRNDFLIPALQQYDKVEVILDGVKGYPCSFISEAFGELISSGFTKDQLNNKLVIKYNDTAYQGYADDINYYIQEHNNEIFSIIS